MDSTSLESRIYGPDGNVLSKVVGSLVYAFDNVILQDGVGYLLRGEKHLF
jgi:hypothetical protein